ncbi:hypothetical protein COT87_02245 [Candidatus Collierbacteria bacterium CG10_big_fil_rev_8_21_14_0_10_44_9]|uniref:Uncharacterized protein n=1 Tax=Candidatus Collierbacteria bacterium CG10_big_fil_rev_8_21_14_0_10_44_9 TaxID=1974535 RepID=A0A2H0VIM1_9BACT|nr:MAG: hypothetical protein COT87_02245 [Candidatus Collierbacteria bacterium CG10_big_fil_rev_8_21_14_0_10_44_9]
MSIIPKDWLEEGNGEVLPFMQLMFVVGKALEIHPWNMQDAIEKAEHKISPQVKIVRLGELRGSYETARANRADLPSFADVLEKVAWIVAAPDDAPVPDDYLSRLNSAINEYERAYLAPEERIHHDKVGRNVH